MTKEVNEKKYSEFRKRKIFRYLYIILEISVVIIEILALFGIINLIWGIVFFVILYLMKKKLIK